MSRKENSREFLRKKGEALVELIRTLRKQKEEEEQMEIDGPFDDFDISMLASDDVDVRQLALRELAKERREEELSMMASVVTQLRYNDKLLKNPEQYYRDCLAKLKKDPIYEQKVRAFLNTPEVKEVRHKNNIFWDFELDVDEDELNETWDEKYKPT